LLNDSQTYDSICTISAKFKNGLSHKHGICRFGRIRDGVKFLTTLPVPGPLRKLFVCHCLSYLRPLILRYLSALNFISTFPIWLPSPSSPKPWIRQLGKHDGVLLLRALWHADGACQYEGYVTVKLDFIMVMESLWRGLG
jgi:hypothetical protein